MKQLLYSILIVSFFLSSCKKEENVQTEKWQFTKLVNANLDNNGNLVSLDFYQKKGSQWRILQFEPDDYINFYNKNTVSTNNNSLPVQNENVIMTSNVKLFDINNDKIYYSFLIKWFVGDPVLFDQNEPFSTLFPDLPTAWKNTNKITTITHSFENAYDNNGKVHTYIFYDFPNQKYVYYAIKNGTDLVIEKNLTDLLPYSNLIDWTSIDAVTCTNSTANEDFYYFFDFDAQKMYVLSRIGKNTNKPKFTLDPNDIVTLNESFFEKSVPNQNKVAFNFSK
jgi:hypothetical protein